MITLQGKGVSAGIAIGKVIFRAGNDFTANKRSIEDTAAESARFHEAREKAAAQLEELAAAMKEKLGEENALLFETHSMLLQDPDFYDPVLAIIEGEKLCAEYAVLEAGSKLAADFAEMDDEYMKERSADIRDVTKRVLAILNGKDTGMETLNEPVILAAEDFSPSETAQMDKSAVLGLVTRAGAANSHTAIFARNMGIPAVIGFGSALSDDMNGKEAALDGETGILCVEPRGDELAEFREKQKAREEEQKTLEKFRGKKTRTRGGKNIALFANIGSVKEAEAALAGDAEGIGLFRSEFLYLGRNDYPDEETQFQSYKTVLEKMEGRQVIIRTLDIGADKQADYFNMPHEENPALGMRAIRLCLKRPELFKTQLRAIYRASMYGNAAIMFPMINSLEDLRRAKAVAAEARGELKAKGIPFNEKVPLGIMIEIPAAAVISDLLAKECDFFSIGTNDLTQYTLAIDRQNESLDGFCNIHHEALLRLIALSCENAHKEGIPVGICGSLGADPDLTQAFLDMGIDELSMAASRILPLRRYIAGL
jgi:phosphotransferase system enzyme I (PtsI)